jgi:hypothetical protein
MAIGQTRSREIQLFERAPRALHTREGPSQHLANQSSFAYVNDH